MRRRAPLDLGDPAGERRLWTDVADVAQRVLRYEAPPPGFVRCEIPVDGAHAEAYAGVATRVNGNPTTVVVVIARTGPVRLDRRALQRRFGLTPREAEVALMLAARKSNKEIAAQLSIAHKTAWGHTEQVLSKLNVGSRRHVRLALEAAVDA